MKMRNSSVKNVFASELRLGNYASTYTTGLHDFDTRVSSRDELSFACDAAEFPL